MRTEIQTCQLEGVQQGMTLRDWFAGQAMVGILAGRSCSWLSDDLAVMAYRFADAILRERDKERDVER